MGKLVLILILVFVIAYAVRRALGARSREDDSGSSGQRGGTQPSSPERMLACQHCNAMTPLSAGVVRGGRFYCTQAHAKKAQDV